MGEPIGVLFLVRAFLNAQRIDIVDEYVPKVDVAVDGDGCEYGGGERRPGGVHYWPVEFENIRWFTFRLSIFQQNLFV